MAHDHILLQAALNGNRNHPAVPRTPEQLARDARIVVEAGARSLHLHAYDEQDRETLAATHCATALPVQESRFPSRRRRVSSPTQTDGERLSPPGQNSPIL